LVFTTANSKNWMQDTILLSTFFSNFFQTFFKLFSNFFQTLFKFFVGLK